jgi:hypothetical protein
MAEVGHLDIQNPQEVHLAESITGLNRPLKRIASSIHGSLHDEHITPWCATHLLKSIWNMAFNLDEV